jgi:hypothetical protein
LLRRDGKGFGGDAFEERRSPRLGRFWRIQSFQPDRPLKTLNGSALILSL